MMIIGRLPTVPAPTSFREMVRLVLFDIDGTLIRTGGAGVGAFADDHEERAGIAAIARERGSRLLKEELRGDQVLVIGDTPFDIHCARAIEAKVLAVATGGSTLEELKLHQPDCAMEDLGKIN